mgnify:CR=1 FL=1
MDFMKLYNEWLENATEDADLIAELESIKGNEDEIYDRFYKALTFGTAGLRGVIGAGTNRMNIYVVRQATQGLANYIIQKYGKGSVAISHDSRIKADLFMLEAARVLAGNGIKVYITSELQPTPVLSYLVRYFKCQAGIMVTASHNPAKYNGYKAYGEDGCQMTDVAAGIVYDEICKLDMFKDVKIADLDEAVKSGLIEYVSDDVYDSYLEKVMEQQVNPGVCEGAGLKVVYTPLNGTGNKLVRKVLKKIGVEEITVVPEQELPDGNFTTCPYPNPEIKEALQKGIELCEKVQPDLLLATDPDADRVGIAMKCPDGSYELVTGNEDKVIARHDRSLNVEVGVTYNLGKATWNKVPDVDAINALHQSELDALNAKLNDANAENDRLKNLLNNQKPVEDKAVKEYVATPVSVFFNIGKSKVASKKDLVNVQALAQYAKDNNAKLVVNGYADSATGSAAVNQKISKARAEKVADELVKLGVAKENIVVKANGGVKDLTPASYNRRATVQVGE